MQKDWSFSAYLVFVCLGLMCCGYSPGSAAATTDFPDTGLYVSPQFNNTQLTSYQDVEYATPANTDGMQYTSDLTKAEERGDSKLHLKLDILVPPNATAVHPQPLVVWIHGGGLGSGNRGRNSKDLLSYAQAGYVVAAVDYRLTPKNKQNPTLRVQAITQATEDVMNAIRFLKVNAKTYHIDTTRIVTVGGSAGGIIALLNAVEYDTLTGTKSNFPGVSAKVAATITTGATLVGNGYDSDFSLHYDANDTPVLLFHAKPTDGATRRTWSDSALPTQTLINNSGNACTAVAQPDHTHTIDWSLDGPYGQDIKPFLWKNLRLQEHP